MTDKKVGYSKIVRKKCTQGLRHSHERKALRNSKRISHLLHGPMRQRGNRPVRLLSEGKDTAQPNCGDRHAPGRIYGISSHDREGKGLRAYLSPPGCWYRSSPHQRGSSSCRVTICLFSQSTRISISRFFSDSCIKNSRQAPQGIPLPPP